MTELPPGAEVRLAPGVRSRDGGRTLVGGAPARVTRLSDRALALFDGARVVVDGVDAARLARTLLDSGTAVPVTASMPEVEPDQVTVVVPVKDRPVELDRLLRGLSKAFGVLVVDDGSTDAAAVVAVARRHGAGVLRLEENLGPAAARNAGLAGSTTPYVVFVDSDVVIGAGALAELVKHFGDPKVGAVAPRIRALAGERTWLASYEAARSPLDLGPRSALVRPHSGVGWVSSAVLAGRREALADGFDPALRVAEDVDLVWRLDAAGWLVRYDAEVVAHHEHRSSPVSWFTRKAYYGTGADPLAVRHGALVAPAVLSASGVAVALAALAQRRWSVPVIGVLTAVNARSAARRLGPGRSSLAAELAADGLRTTGVQVSALLLRHWWPGTVVGALFSRRVRRAAAVAVMVDAVVTYRRAETDLDPVRFAVARRLDDLAYGSGVWASAIRGGSLRALTPKITRRG